MRACLSITLTCRKMFHPRKPIYHPQELFYLIGAVANLSSTKPIYHPQELFFFYLRAVEKFPSTKPIYHLRELVFLFLWAVEN